MALPVPFRRHLKPRLPKESIHDNAKENHHRRSGDHRGYCNEGTKKSCTVVRKANGELVSKTEPTPSRAPIWEKPIFRGAYTLFTAMKEGMQAINYSASFFEDEEADVPPSKFELWLEKKFGSEGLNKIILSISTVIGIALPIGLFILLPSFLGGFVPKPGVCSRAMYSRAACASFCSCCSCGQCRI